MLRRFVVTAIVLSLCCLLLSCGSLLPPDASGQVLYALSANGVAAYSVSSNGGLHPLPGSPYATQSSAWHLAAAGNRFVYVTEYLSGAYTVRTYGVDPKTGALAEQGVRAFAGIPSGIAAHPSGKYLYIDEYSTDSIRALRIGPDGGLTDINSGSLVGVQGWQAEWQLTSVIGASLKPTGDFLFVTMASASGVAAFKVDTATGMLGAQPESVLILPERRAPENSAVHPSGKYLYVFDANQLFHIAGTTEQPGGIGAVLAYSVDPTTGALTELGGPYRVGKPATYGVVHPNGEILFVSGGGSISAFRIQPSGGLEEIGTFGAGGALAMSVGGNFLYEQTRDAVNAYRIAPDGSVTSLGSTPSPQGYYPSMAVVQLGN